MSGSAVVVPAQPGSNRALVIIISAALAIAGFIPVAFGQLAFLSYLGLVFGLAFVGLFLTNLRVFILCFVALRGLMEFFLEPTKIVLGGFSVQLVGILGVIILIGGMSYIMINRVQIREVSVVGPMLIFLVSSLPATLLLSLDKVAGFKDWVGTASAVMLFLLISAVFCNRKDLRLLIISVLLSTIVPLIVGFYQLFTDTGNHQREGLNSIYSTFAHPNPYAIYLVMMLLLCLPLLLDARTARDRLPMAALCMALSVSLVFTYARAPWLGFLAGVAILALVRYRKLLLLAPVAVAMIVVLFPSILTRIEEVTSFTRGTGSMVFRVEMWKYLLPKFYSNPIVGNGLGSYVKYAESGLGYYYLPHNDYIRVLVDTGIVGLISYLAALFGLLRGSIRSYRVFEDAQFKTLALVTVSVVVVYFLGGVTENLFRGGTTQTYFWTLIGITAAAARIVYREKAENKVIEPS